MREHAPLGERYFGRATILHIASFVVGLEVEDFDQFTKEVWPAVGEYVDAGLHHTIKNPELVLPEFLVTEELPAETQRQHNSKRFFYPRDKQDRLVHFEWLKIDQSIKRPDTMPKTAPRLSLNRDKQLPLFELQMRKQEDGVQYNYKILDK